MGSTFVTNESFCKLCCLSTYIHSRKSNASSSAVLVCHLSKHTVCDTCLTLSLFRSIPSQHGLQNMQPMQSYNQQTNNNHWPQASNALGVYTPTPVLSSSQRQTVAQPHPTYPNQPPYLMPSYGTNNNQWGSSNPGFYQ